MNLPHLLDPIEMVTIVGKADGATGIIARKPLWVALVLFALPLAAQVGPTITRQPADVSRSLGDKATLTVTATGDAPLSYQWHWQGSALNGATHRSLTLTNLTADQAGTYTVIVSNAVNAVTSNPAVLDVNTLFRLVGESPVSRDNTFGMAWGDYDNDGFPDLLASGSANSVLYHNNGDGSWTRNPSAAKTVTGRAYGADNIWSAYWADYDNDGLLDLLVPTGGNLIAERDQLFRGLGAGVFQSVTNAPIATDSFVTMDGVWGDFNNDGRLDLFTTRVNPDGSNAPQELYWWLGLGGKFSRVESADFAQDPLRSAYGATAGDFNNDGRRDIAIAIGRGAVLVYQNQGGQKFEPFVQPGSGSFIGSPAAADFDNDGDLDVFVTFGKGNCQLLRNDGTGNFELVEGAEPVTESGRSVSAAWGDYDNDGWLDLFVCRSAQWASDGDRNDSLFHNQGDGTFSRVAAGTLTQDGSDGAGCAWADYDNDGFLDLAVSGTPSHLFHNTGNANHWLVLKLVGTTSNRSALGARVRLKATLTGKAITQHREIGTGAGWSQNDLRAHFGLGDASQADEIVIEWPSGQKQTLTNVAAKQILTVVEPDGAPRLTITTDGDIVLQLEGDPDTAYALEYASELTGDWSPFGGGSVKTDGSGKAAVVVFFSVPGKSWDIFLRARVP